MENLQQKVINWVKTLKGWQCELAYRLLNRDCHVRSKSAYYISVHQKFINKQQCC